MLEEMTTKLVQDNYLSVSSTHACLQRLGQAMVNMQRQQEHLFAQMRLDFATKMAAQGETNLRDIEEALRSELVQKGRHQKEKEFIDHAVNYIDTCSRADGHVVPDPRPSRGGLGSRHRGRDKGTLSPSW
jgi:hypothetical protein